MDQRSDDIRQDIESTRAALSDKLDTLETRAREAFDLKRQVAEHPWMALGAAVAVGYALGSLGGERSMQRWSGQPITTTDYTQHTPLPAAHAPARSEGLLAQLDDELELLKGAAASMLTTLLRDTIREYAPSFGHQLDRMAPAQHRLPSTATNTSYATGARQTGFDSPSTTGSQLANPEIEGARHAAPHAPPGAATEGREYIKTYHPPDEPARERR